MRMLTSSPLPEIRGDHVEALAEAAIIASVMAKSQLLTRRQFIHLELAPAVQAVTVDVFSEDTRQPMRHLLTHSLAALFQPHR